MELWTNEPGQKIDEFCDIKKSIEIIWSSTDSQCFIHSLNANQTKNAQWASK
jgi:hypothetical protein